MEGIKEPKRFHPIDHTRTFETVDIIVPAEDAVCIKDEWWIDRFL